MGKLKQRKDGRYQTKVYLGIVNGKPKYKYVYGNSPREVERKANELRYKKEHNIYVNPRNIYIEDLLTEWLEIHKMNVAETTYELYKMQIRKHISPYLGKIKLSKILPMHIQKFYNEKLKTQKGQTVCKYHNMMHNAFDFAVRNNMILYNPCDRVKKPRTEKYTPVVCDDETFFKLLKITRGTFDEIPIILAAGMGFRRGEIFGLKWQDIDFKKNTISIKRSIVRFHKYIEKKPKSESSIRKNTMPEMVAETLKRYRKKKNVITGYVCKEYKPDSYSKHFKKLIEDHDLPPIRFHDLRHYNAILMMKIGIPDKIAASRMGHSDTKTLKEIYQHVTTDMDEYAAQKLNKALTGTL